MTRYKVGDRVKLNAEYLAPHTGTVTQAHTFEDGSPTEYMVQLDRCLARYLAQELSEEDSE